MTSFQTAISRLGAILLWASFGLSSLCIAKDEQLTSSGLSPLLASRALLVSEMFDPEIVAENVFAVRHHQSEMSEIDRYEYLASWVLPSDTHSDIRISGAFTPTDPVPVLPSEYLDVTGSGGGRLVSPVFDLLDVAVKLGRLEELRQQVDMIPTPRGESQQRAFAAMRIMLASELNDVGTVEAEVKTLQKLVISAVPKSVSDQWPETLVAWRSVQKFPASAACDILGDLVSYRMQRGIPKECTEWHSQIFSLAGQLKTFQLRGTAMELESTQKLRNWIPVNRTRWIRDAAGVSDASWQFRGDECMHVTGRDEDYLIYRSPLTGNFDFELDVHPYGSTQLVAAGDIFGPRSNHEEFETGNIRIGAGHAKMIHPPLNKFDEWVRCRASFRDGTRTVFINGRIVATDMLPEHHDPWVGFRSWCRSDGRVRNVQISGKPTIPDAVLLSEAPDLTGWFSHLDDSVNHEYAYWNYVRTANQPAEIVGRMLTGHSGMNSERLLRYFRPLEKDGTIEYEFFYESGKAVTHPALDRLALILAPEGVRIHWVTDGSCDRTDLRPDNETVEQDNRRGPAKLPLKQGEWNQMKVIVTDDVVSLQLNGNDIYERPLETTNSREFGLFHFADQGVARVRNVVMRGDWPKTLPSVSQQELTNSTLTSLDVERSHAATSMVHDFSVDGLPKEYFTAPPTIAQCQTELTDVGVNQDMRSPGNWTQASITSLFQMHGNFDVSVGFDNWATAGHDHYGAALIINCSSGHRIQIGRRRDKKNDDHGIVVGWLIPAGNGQFRPTYQWIRTEATAGHLRMARRGDRWFAMFAENDSSSYQFVGQQVLEGTDDQSVVFEMQSIATDGGTSHVLWKDVQITSDKLMIFPDPQAAPRAGLFVMNADGTDLREIPLKDETITSPGSADWSPDGKQIAFDEYSTSSIYLVNVDGTELKKIGRGAMPTFSADGNQLAFSGGGMSVMDTNGENIKVLSQDGWGAQWSPNGKWLAYESHSRVGNMTFTNITLIDVNTKEKRTILEGDQAERYIQVNWNMEWSPDSEQICFKGKKRDAATEMAITNIAGSSKGFTVVTNEEVVEDFSWHPDGSRILMAKHSPQHVGPRLYICDTRTLKITLLGVQPMDQKSVSGVWSPNGHQIVFSSTPNPKAVPWQAPGNTGVIK